jgi:acyl-lipid omega-6 desaturase (Delta-12 desaturase)
VNGVLSRRLERIEARRPFASLEMRTGKNLISATKPYAHENLAYSWWSFGSTLLLFISLLVGTTLPIPFGLRLGLSLLAGLVLLRLFVIYHDQQHHAILARSPLAGLILRAFGIYALSPTSIWRSSHNHHHNHNSKLRGSHIGSFPVMTRTRFDESSRTQRFSYLVSRHPLTILLGYPTVFLYGMCIAPALRDPRRHLDCCIALCLHAIICTLFVILGNWLGLTLSYLLPFFVAGAIGAYLFYAQHNFPGVSFNDANGWTYEKAALDSSSFLRMGQLMNWFTGNIGYHHIHHLNSRIPFYRLPEVFKGIPELQTPKTTSLHPGEIRRCLRLKFWDAEQQEMVDLKGKPVFGRYWRRSGTARDPDLAR